MTARRIAIIGSGPAGSAAAIAARLSDRHAEVVLLDRHDFPRDKSCGDGIAEHVVSSLAELGLGDLLDDRRPATELELATRTDSATRPLVGRLFGVPRRDFDQLLLAAARKHDVEWRRQFVRAVKRRRGRLVIDDEAEADVVIGADGVESVVRRIVRVPQNGPRQTALAIRGYTESTSSRARLVSWGRDWPAYAWEFPLGDGRSNVGYGEVLQRDSSLTRSHLLERLEALMPGSTTHASDWRAARIPLSTHRPRQSNGPILLAGDAASLVNPMSGEGISYAIRSGILAGRAAALASDPGQVYRRALRSAFGKNLRHANLMARIGQVGSAAELGTRMTVVDPDFFDNQVEVSIGGGIYRWPIVVRAMVRALAAGKSERQTEPSTTG